MKHPVLRKKLVLAKESLRCLTKVELGDVVGGIPPSRNETLCILTCVSCYRTCTC